MGLGGHLTWTAVARELVHKSQVNGLKILPVEASGNNIINIIQSEVFSNNPYFTTDTAYEPKFVLPMNLPETNYCKQDLPHRVVQRGDKHIIEQICEYYDILEPELRCEFFLLNEEKQKAREILKKVDKNFIVIEPHSKTNYTPNRSYSFEKWQKIVNELSELRTVIQIGAKGSKILDNVIDFTGIVTFREATEIIEHSDLFLSTEGGMAHGATTTSTKSIIIFTGYQSEKMVAYPQNININISSHGPCGLKIPCEQCKKDVESHNEKEIVKIASEYLKSLNE
jgi:ADP-heptose:LPS heptosyltransferase